MPIYSVIGIKSRSPGTVETTHGAVQTQCSCLWERRLGNNGPMNWRIWVR